MTSLYWVGTDLDGTLAHYTSWTEQGNIIGDPIPAMVNRVKQWLANGITVKIFTARVGQNELIWEWLEHVGLPRLDITNVKDIHMIALWDDRAVQVEKNVGCSVLPGSEYRITYGGKTLPWDGDEAA